MRDQEIIAETEAMEKMDAEEIKRWNSQRDAVNHPAHYNVGKIEVVEFIEDQKLCYHVGNALKYICRAGRKDPAKTVEDLKKAIWYLQRRIELESDKPRRPNEMTK